MNKFSFTILAITLILLSSCIYFQTIDQPSVALPNEIFTVSITVNTEGGEYEPYFGVCLPIGWTIPGDSIQCSGAYNETIYYDSLISIIQENFSPAPVGYYWWAGKGVVDTSAIGEVYADLFIQTDNQTGIFSIDYMLGDSGNGVNHQRSNDHQIEISDEFTPYGFQAAVVGETVFLNWSEPYNTNGLLGYNIYRNDQKINPLLVTNTTFIDENPLEGIHYYSVSSYYSNGTEYFIPYEVPVMFGNNLYVSLNGNNSNSGASFNESLLTINFAISMILPDSLNVVTIYLAPGVYSTYTNGEQYPILFKSYISLWGSGEEETILDADEENTVLEVINEQDVTISGLTLRNGSSFNGGGAYCSSSNVNFSNMTITSNKALDYESFGGGIYIADTSNVSLTNVVITENISRYGGGIYCNGSSLDLVNVDISNNYADISGGGFYCSASVLDLVNVNILNNTAASSGGGINCESTDIGFVYGNIEYNTSNSGGGINCRDSSLLNLVNLNILNNTATNNGGGIKCNESSVIDFVNVHITNNTATETGGGVNCSNNSFLNFNNANRSNIYFNQALIGNDVYSDALQDVVVDTFTVLNPTDYHTSPIENFTFDILKGKIIQAEADLFVSPIGDNTNSGLTEGDPLKTIHCALAKIIVDSLHPHTINLLDGTYSQPTNGEAFPLNIFNYVSLSGISDSSVILDANGFSNVFRIYNSSETFITDLTIRGGNAGDGGGLYCKNSNLKLMNVRLLDNYASNGGGIYCDNSNPLLENVTIANNSVKWDGGGINCSNSSPTLVSTIIVKDSARNGGGVFCSDNSNPVFENVTIINNTASRDGGGIYTGNNSKPIFTNVTITNNTAADDGGGIYCQASLLLENVIIINNNASDYGGGGIYCSGGYILIKNCILWNYSLYDIINSFGTITISYTDFPAGHRIRGGAYLLEGIKYEDPLFIGTGGNPYILSSNSPCIDAGHPHSIYYDPEDPNNLGYALWPAMGTVRNDMGAYGGPNAASWNIVVGVEDETKDFELPTKYELFQNYPNPFNPSTKIKYSIFEKSFVELKLYDILGREVKVLVNEEQDAGYHQIDFNAWQYASGIYIYRLQAGDFIEAKKMILLK